jgi:O-antigen/teichoic acid export membrane protein
MLPRVTIGQAMLRYGLKAHAGGLASQMNFRLDQAVMAAWVAPAQLGLYVAAVSASSLTQILPLAVRIVATPSIARRPDEDERIETLKMYFRNYWALSLVLTGACAFALPWALPLVYGEGFRDALWPAEILMIGSVFLGGTTVLTGGAQALGNPWLGSRAELAGLVVTVALLVMLLPVLGITGAAIASAAAYGVALFVLARGIARTSTISVMELLGIDGLQSRRAIQRLLASVSR